MIAVDTNVIVRFLVRDDEKQAAAVYRRLKQAEKNRERLFIPLLVTLETIWVLESAYDRARGEVLEAIEALRQMTVFEFEKDQVIGDLLSGGRKCRADLADLLIAHSAKSCGCESGITFDRAAAKLPFFSLLN